MVVNNKVFEITNDGHLKKMLKTTNAWPSTIIPPKCGK
jgi:hypothetical protein